MNFITQASTLKAVLARIGLAVNAKSTNPILTNILVDVDYNVVTFTTTDLEITISYKLECQTEGEPTAILVPFAELKKLIALESGEVAFSLDDEGRTLLKCVTDTFCLGKPGDASEFPSVPSIASKRMFEINGTFLPSLSMAALGVSTDDLRPALTCILVEVAPDSINIVSADGYALFHREIKVKLAVEAQEDLLVPARIADVLDGFNTTKVGFNSKHMAFEASNVTVCCKRGDAKYPTWRSIVTPHNPNVTITLNELSQALEKALIVAGNVNNSGIDFKPSIDSMLLSVDRPETGMSANCRITAEAATCAVEKIVLNGRLLKRALTQLEGHGVDADKVNIGIYQVNKAITARIDGVDDLYVTVMPITQN